MPFPTACYHQGGAVLAWDKRERGARGVRPLGKLSLPKSISDRLVCSVCLEQHWGSSNLEKFYSSHARVLLLLRRTRQPRAGLGWAGEAPRCPRPPPLPGRLFILPGAAGCPGRAGMPSRDKWSRDKMPILSASTWADPERSGSVEDWGVPGVGPTPLSSVLIPLAVKWDLTKYFLWVWLSFH